MNRFIKIENNMIIGERFDSLNRIVEGEIVANESHGQVGQVWNGSAWVWETEFVGGDEINLALLKAEGVIE